MGPKKRSQTKTTKSERTPGIQEVFDRKRKPIDDPHGIHIKSSKQPELLKVPSDASDSLPEMNKRLRKSEELLADPKSPVLTPEQKELLHRFDVNASYGPCSSLSRLARWNRAHKLGLNPSNDVKLLLDSLHSNHECFHAIWFKKI
eukprot:CAMPEP_0114540034 /NCGR_PEP_ID=MMETSP0114-20121206/551_1 /TAXON_ID=31324 /ORGANISM="Goniomonas sp, Strain m" /LENGTH=145 /DNA_ID=CAMNT_0001724167 /DNA_START=24 /DNA_END=461 /DNA_ORIENTATION=-